MLYGIRYISMFRSGTNAEADNVHHDSSAQSQGQTPQHGAPRRTQPKRLKRSRWVFKSNAAYVLVCCTTIIPQGFRDRSSRLLGALSQRGCPDWQVKAHRSRQASQHARMYLASLVLPAEPVKLRRADTWQAISDESNSIAPTRSDLLSPPFSPGSQKARCCGARALVLGDGPLRRLVVEAVPFAHGAAHGQQVDAPLRPGVHAPLQGVVRHALPDVRRPPEGGPAPHPQKTS